MRSIQSFLLAITVYCVFIGLNVSCSDNNYISPLRDVTLDSLVFDYLQDSRIINLSGLNQSNCEISSTSAWCSVNVEETHITICVEKNSSDKDRQSYVVIRDIYDNTQIDFIVYQKSREIQDILNSFVLISQSGHEFRPFLVDDKNIFIEVPNTENLDSMLIKIEHPMNSVYIDDKRPIDGERYDFSDFTIPHTLYIEVNNETISKKIVVFDLPVLMITTPDSLPIVSKTVRKEGCSLSLVLPDNVIDSLGTAGIRGRGNISWEQPKKPYNIKLDKKHSILDMEKSKHWQLLANATFDRTQLHNDVAFKIAQMTDYKWVQSGRFVELIINGSHEGLYYLCEKVRIESSKINITEITPSDTVGISLTGGYMLEGGISKDYPTSFTTSFYNTTVGAYPLYWEFVKPEDSIPEAQINYITNALNKLESLIANDSTLFLGSYREYLDIESAINWWLVQNLCINEEACRAKNLFLYKDRDSSIGVSKFTIGPPWDFDAWSFGTGGLRFLPVYDLTWCYGDLLRDPFFVNRLKEKWCDYYESWKKEIPVYIDSQYNYIYRSARRNEVLWPDWPYSLESFEQSVVEMKEAFSVQIEWMNSFILGL